MSFEAAVRRDGDVPVIDLRGDIDGAADAAMNEAYGQATAGGQSSVVLNFGEVGYINSTGIAVIVGMLAKARQGRVAVAAYGLTDHYKEIFEITRLAEFVTICANEASATQRGGTA